MTSKAMQGNQSGVPQLRVKVGDIVAGHHAPRNAFSAPCHPQGNRAPTFLAPRNGLKNYDAAAMNGHGNRNG